MLLVTVGAIVCWGSLPLHLDGRRRFCSGFLERSLGTDRLSLLVDEAMFVNMMNVFELYVALHCGGKRHFDIPLLS